MGGGRLQWHLVRQDNYGDEAEQQIIYGLRSASLDFMFSIICINLVWLGIGMSTVDSLDDNPPYESNL